MFIQQRPDRCISNSEKKALELLKFAAMFSFNPSQWCSNSYIPLLKVILSHDKTEGGGHKTFDCNIYIKQLKKKVNWFCSGGKIRHTSYQFFFVSFYWRLEKFGKSCRGLPAPALTLLNWDTNQRILVLSDLTEHQLVTNVDRKVLFPREILFCLQYSFSSQTASLHIKFHIYMTGWCVCTPNIELRSYREVLEGVEQEAQGHLGFIEQWLGLRDAC